MLEAWKSPAKKEGITLIAPALPRVAAFEEVAPEVFRCRVEEAEKVVPLDPQRIYIFGHSMGGDPGYDAAMRQSNHFAAAIHAMGISEDYYSIVARAEGKIPVAIYIGDSMFHSRVSMRVRSLGVKAAASFLTSPSNAPRLFRGSGTTELNPA
jgi:predicted peptidase